MKYIIQPNEYTCAPTALFNLLTWANQHNKNVTYRKLLSYTNCDPVHGGSHSNFNDAIQAIITFTNLVLIDYITYPCMDIIIQSLLKNYGIILCFHWVHKTTYGDHVVFIDEYKNNKFNIINPYNSIQNTHKMKNIEINHHQMKHLLKPYCNRKQLEAPEYPKIWIFKTKKS